MQEEIAENAAICIFQASTRLAPHATPDPTATLIKDDPNMETWPTKDCCPLYPGPHSLQEP